METEKYGHVEVGNSSDGDSLKRNVESRRTE